MIVRVEAPARLHFGLLGWSADAPRQFGGVGLMIESPPTVVEAAIAGPPIDPIGPDAARLAAVVDRVRSRMVAAGVDPPAAAVRIASSPPAHAGFGSGTQLGMAVARALAEVAGRGDADAATLAGWSGRGRRSGVGALGFGLGGLIVDGGRRGPAGTEDGPPPPLVARLEFPAEWSVLVAVPSPPAGLHGPGEAAAFGRLPGVPGAATDRLCRLVLLGLLPAVAERDLPAFGAALSEIQAIVGGLFAPEQGGPFAPRGSAEVAARMIDRGLVGVGQSSWGPAVYGLTDAPADRRAEVLRSIGEEAGLRGDSLFWTRAANAGARVSTLPDDGGDRPCP